MRSRALGIGAMVAMAAGGFGSALADGAAPAVLTSDARGGPGAGAAPAKREVRVMQIKFVRSGGVAAMPGLTVEGTIELGDQAPAVTSDAAKYRRDLAGPEADELRSAAAPGAMSTAKSALASRSAAPRDAYHYEISVATSDGKTQRIALNAAGGEEVGHVAPGVGRLVRWIDQEAQRIKEHRLQSR
jgi:hypothetical protein